MSARTLSVSIAAACLLAACGGGSAPPSVSTRLLADAASVAPLSFTGVRADYSITATADGYTVVELGSGAGTAVPRDARLRFADISIGLDLDGNAARAYRLYRAAFARIPDAGGLGYWIVQLDHGADPVAVAAAFMASSEFAQRYGTGLGDADFVDKLYHNVLGRAGEPAGAAFWTGVLQSGAVTRAQVLAAFGESAEDKAVVREEIRNGIPFLEDGVAYLPAANPGANRVVDLARPAVLDGSASTVAIGRSITYSWSLASKPPGSAAVLEQAASAHPRFVPDVQGNYELKLVVSDGSASSRATSVIVGAVPWPDEGPLPATGNFAHFVGDGSLAGNSIGINSTFTLANATFDVNVAGNRLAVNVTGEQLWGGDFGVLSSLGRLAPGYYGDLGADIWSDTGGMWAWGSETNCTATGGWFAIDRVVYDGDQLAALDMRFEQRCDTSPSVLRGRVHWSRDAAAQVAVQ
jgi:hypothetical protein